MNVYTLVKMVNKEEEVKSIPLYSTLQQNQKYHANFFQTWNSRNSHYVVINNTSRLQTNIWLTVHLNI